MNEIINFYTILLASSILIILVGIINFKTLKRSWPLGVLFILFIVSVTSDIAGTAMQNRGIHNLWLYNLYNLIEYSLLAIFFILLFQFKRQGQIISSIVYLTILTLMIFISVSQSFTEHFNSTLMGLQSIVLICSSVLYFRVMLNNLEFETPWSNPFFWINSAILIYFSGCFFIFIFSDYRDVTRTIKIWDIHNIIHIIYNLLILIGFWKARKA